MIKLATGRDVWGQLQPLLDSPTPKTAAIAYVGKDADQYLHLHGGDVLEFAGEDSSVAQRHVDLAQINNWLRQGVRLFSLPGLHAKVIVVEAKSTLAIVGSANASVTSATDKAEASVVVRDRSTVDALREQVLAWAALGKKVDAAWVAHARTIPRQPRQRSSVYELDADRMLADRQADMWVLIWLYEGTVPAKIEREADQVGADLDVYVSTFPLHHYVEDRHLYDQIAEDDSLLMIPLSANAKWPRKNANIEEPATVLKKIPKPSGGGYLVLGWRWGFTTKKWPAVEEALGESIANISERFDVHEHNRVAIFDLFDK